MTLDTSQLGRAGELALSLYSLITSEGQVELYSPVVDEIKAMPSAPEWLVTLTKS
jgi:hypothetical protein